MENVENKTEYLLSIEHLSKSFGKNHVLKDITLKYRGSKNQRVIDIKKTFRDPNNKVKDNIYFVTEIVELEGC